MEGLSISLKDILANRLTTQEGEIWLDQVCPGVSYDLDVPRTPPKEGFQEASRLDA